jgi:hypothetical protein
MGAIEHAHVTAGASDLELRRLQRRHLAICSRYQDGDALRRLW